MQHDAAPRWSPARLAYGFYTVAAAGAVIGQTWVAYTHVPWPDAVPAWARIAAVLPFALCLELLAMALAAMGDQRMRLGEHAYGFRIFSTLIATVAVGILVLGHWPHYYWSASFGILSTSAYLLWLLHSAARRRDALRAAGKLADTAPDYGLWWRLRYPVWTARAAELARQGHTDPASGTWRPLSLYESLHAAQLAIRADKRRPALAKAVEQVVRADHPDPKMADIAVHTLDLDRIATELEHRVNYTAWADRLAPAITTPATPQGDDKRPEPPTLAASTRTASVRSARERRRSRRTRILVWPEPGAADPVAVKPNLPPARSPAPAPIPTTGHPHPEQPRNGKPAADPVADTIRALSVADLAVGGGAGTRVGDDAVTVDAHAADPVTTGPVTTDPISMDAKTAALSETAAAVAYWRDRHPHLRPAQIAERVGCSVRHVRRILAALDDIGAPEPDGAALPDLADSHR